MILGRHLGFLRPDSNGKLTTQLAEAVRIHFMASRDAFYGLPLWKLLPTSAYKQLIESEDAIYKYALSAYLRHSREKHFPFIIEPFGTCLYLVKTVLPEGEIEDY